MKTGMTAALGAMALAGCATIAPDPAPVDVKIIALNDFHGNLEPPRQSIETGPIDGPSLRVPAGGAAYLASAIDSLRAANPNHITVSAGDMIGATPLVSALFVDEPTIHAMNLIEVDLNAVGNHEFDKGRAELLRMQNGGCAQHGVREPCQLEPFTGADFRFLAANTLTEDGTSLFAPYAIRSFGSGARQVKIGFIGLTLEGTDALVTPAGIAGLSFADEADTANALVPRIRAEGAEAIVLLIHQGATTTGRYNDKGCEGLGGDLLPILDRLDPEIDLVVSGHTHAAYICDYGAHNPARPFLVTSAGRYGTLVSDITLSIDPASGEVVAKRADNVIVQGEAYGAVALSDAFPVFPRDAEVAALVDRYAAAAAPLAARPIGRLSAPATREQTASREQALGALVADAQLAATRVSGAEIAFMNPGGVRADLIPAANGSVTYGQIFSAQPFGNTLVVKSFTGAQLRALLEQQFDSGSNSVAQPMLLLPSDGFRYSYDLSRPAGQRIIDPTLNGAPLDDERVYRVAMNSFLASGGDNFTLFRDGTNVVGGPGDVDALEAYIKAGSPLAPPAPGRITDLTPATAG